MLVVAMNGNVNLPSLTHSDNKSSENLEGKFQDLLPLNLFAQQTEWIE